MWPELTEYVLGGGQPILAALFFLLAIWLLLGGRIWSKSRGLGAPPAHLAAAFQAPRAGRRSVKAGDEKVSALTASWIARGADSVEHPPAEAPAAPEPRPVEPDPATDRDTGERQVDPGELIRWGQQAARAGDRLVAYRMFGRALEIDSTLEEGWLWRAATADRDDEVVECLERVLELNPFSEKACGGLTEARRRLGQERGRTAS